MLNGNKSDFYKSAEGYKDDDGNTRQFTMIDHDVKPKIATGIWDMEEISIQRKQYREDLVNTILKLPASLSPIEYSDFIVRGEGKTSLSWNESMIRDKGMDIIKLVFLKNILEVRKEQALKHL